MRKNPVIPYAIIAVIGVLAVIIISFIGIDQSQDIQQAEENGEEQTEQSEEGSEEGGETTAGNGEEVFQSNCAMCHGSDLASGSAPDLTQVGSTYSQEEIAQIVQEGIGTMPAQSHVQGEDLEALTEWLSEQQ